MGALSMRLHNSFTNQSPHGDNCATRVAQRRGMKTKLICLVALTVALRLSATPPPEGEFVAHEWGTFTSVHGADGHQIEWNPLIGTDLPGFVYNRNIRQGGFSPEVRFLDTFGKGAVLTLIRMETPVIYFYSEKARTVDVTVNFKNGRITEWYPQATRVGPYHTTNQAELLPASRSFIEWSGLKILPRDTREIAASQLIREKGESHYYSARETDANFLRMSSPHARSPVEYERDLFYRGVGSFQAPLTLNLQANEEYLQLSTKNREPLTDLFVLTIRNGMARYQVVDQVAATKERMVKLEHGPLAPLSKVQEKIMAEMKAALVKQGLYAREAEAMVYTWKDLWFAEEGVRVLYLRPAKWTDDMLPLSIEPRPQEAIRVMVGRAELITPAMEWELNKQVVLYGGGDDQEKRQAIAAVRRLGLGRFVEPATRKILGRLPTKEFSRAAWNLAQEASKEPNSRTPAAVEQEPPAIPSNKGLKRTAAVRPQLNSIAAQAGF
jgi:hypothetical protein